MTRRKTIRSLQKSRDEGTPITMVTCYDATFARLMDTCDIDAFLVGDSLGNVIQGHDSTLPVTLDDIIYHTRAVVRGSSRAHIVADMPFLSYGAGLDEAILAAGRLIKDGGAQAVKLEGGREFAELVHRLVGIGVPVMGHLGLTPQSVHAMGGYHVQGRGDAGARLLEDARILEEAGAYAIVLEMVPGPLAAQVTQALRIPTIGIGAGNQTSGQVLVSYDLLGLNDGFSPRFLKRFAELGTTVREATDAYAAEVRAGTYPAPAHTFES